MANPLLRSMRPVLLVECLVDILGGQRVALQIADAIKGNFPVVLACPGPGQLADAARADGLEVRYCPALGDGSPKRLFSNSRLAKKLIADVNPGLIYVNGMTGLPAMHFANRSRQVAMIMHLHHLVKSPLNRAMLRYIHKRNKGGASVTCSATVAEFCGWPSEEVTVIHNGVDVGRFQECATDQTAARASLGSNNERFLVCFIGDIGGIKPHRLVIAAALLAAEKNPNLQVIFAGRITPNGEALVAEAKASAARAGVPDLFVFLGWRADLEKIYPACDLTILGHEEGFPLSGLESAACGTDLALPDSGGGAELGKLLGINERYSAGDAYSLALRINESVRSLSPSNGRRIASIVRSRFSTAAFQQRILQLTAPKST